MPACGAERFASTWGKPLKPLCGKTRWAMLFSDFISIIIWMVASSSTPPPPSLGSVTYKYIPVPEQSISPPEEGTIRSTKIAIAIGISGESS